MDTSAKPCPFCADTTARICPDGGNEATVRLRAWLGTLDTATIKDVAERAIHERFEAISTLAMAHDTHRRVLNRLRERVQALADLYRNTYVAGRTLETCAQDLDKILAEDV